MATTVEPLDLSWGRTFSNGFPHEFFAWLRREHPVWWHEPTEHTPDGEGFWVVSRHADVVTMFKDAATFSSELGGTQIADSRGLGIQLNQTDDPQHRRLRALVNKGFTPRMIGRLEDDLRARARVILDAVPTGEVFDFAPLVAAELPLQAICSILGVPQEDRAELNAILDEGINAETGEILGGDALRLLGRYAKQLVEKKRRQPDDDILSVIIHARLDDGSPQLDDRELRAFFALLFPAGAETTRSAISGGVLALIENLDQQTRLRASLAAGEPELMKSAIEEIVRWSSPSVYKRRTASRDVTLDGQRIEQGQKVTLWEMSANHDEDVFDQPFRFDVGRSPNPHVGFGLGTHFCLGASLARLELKVMVEEILGRFTDLEVAGEPRWPANNRLVGMSSLPLVVR